MTSTSAARNSGPAVNLHNENPSLVAFRKNILQDGYGVSGTQNETVPEASEIHRSVVIHDISLHKRFFKQNFQKHFAGGLRSFWDPK